MFRVNTLTQRPRELTSAILPSASDRQHEICSIHHDYFLATGDATFPTIYQILGVAQDANDVAILLATGRWRQRQARLQPDRAAVVLEEGGRISAADLEPAHVITPMAAVLLDKRIRKVYDTYFVPTLSKKTAWGNSQRGKQFEKMCGEFIVRRG